MMNDEETGQGTTKLKEPGDSHGLAE